MIHQETDIILELEAERESCLAMLFDNYYHALCIYALRFVSNSDDAEDIVQEVFISFWQKKKGTQFSGSIRSYLFKAVTNIATNYTTRRKLVYEEVDKYTDHFWEEWNPLEERSSEKLLQKVNEEIEKLPHKTKEIFQAVVLSGLTYKQIGIRFNISENTVKTLYYRAIKQLRKSLEDNLLILFYLLQKP